MRRHLILALAALILLICAPMYGQDMQLVIDDNAGNVAIFNVFGAVVVPDFTGCLGVGGCALASLYTPGTDVLFVTGSIGQFTINNITGQGGGLNLNQTHQNLTQSEASSLGAGQLNVLFTDANYDNLGSPFSMSGTITNNVDSSGSSVQFDMGVGAAGPILGPAPLLAGGTLPLLTCTTTGTCTDGETNPGILNTFGPVGNLTAYKEIIFSGRGTVQTTLTITSLVPEPATFAMLGAMMLGAGLTMRRKFGRS